MAVVKQRIAAMESVLETLDQQEDKYAAELGEALAQYAELRQQATDMDTTELKTARQVIRPDKEREMERHLQATYRKKIDSRLLIQSRKDIADLLDEVVDPISVRENLRQSVAQTDKQRYTNGRDQER